MDIGQILSWVVSVVGLTGFYFAGKKKWWSWYINLGCQILWATYALVTGYLAFLAFAAVYSVIFAINAYKWTKEHLAVKRMLAMEEPNEVPEESNLVKHARYELNLINEDFDTKEWYIRVIKEYTRFGHSGGSAWATLQVLEELLRFRPLTELTDDPEEWIYHGKDMWDGVNGIWQNTRDGRMFSGDGGKTYWCVDDPKDADGARQMYDSISKDQWTVDHGHISQG